MGVRRSLKFLPGTGRGTVRRTVEGTARHGAVNYVFDHSSFIPKHISGRDPQHRDILAGQPIIPFDVSLRPITETVALPIDLDREPRLSAEEIEHIRTSGMLTPEPEPTRPRAQQTPQQAFRQTERPTQSSRVFDGLSRSGEHCAFPSTTLRAVPLPVPGRNFNI